MGFECICWYLRVLRVLRIFEGFEGLEEIDLEYTRTDVLYYIEVRWLNKLNKGSMASRMYDLLPKICECFQNNKMVKKFPFIFDDVQALHLAFLSDMFTS